MATAAKAIRVHQIQGGKIEGVQYMDYATGQTFKLGEVLVFEGGSTGNVIVASANPGSGTIVGVSLQAADTSPGFAAANSPTTFTGRSQKVSVVRPNDQTIFESEFTNNSSTVIAPAKTDIGIQYGITAYSGIWTVDKNKTAGNARVVVTGIDTDQNVIFWKFIASFLA